MNIILRKWKLDDISKLVEHANNYEVAKFLTNGFPHPYTIEDAEQFIGSVKDVEPTNILAIDFNGEAIGSIGLFPQTDIHCKNAELGYFLGEKFWGKGIMSEAVSQMVEYGFHTFDIDRIYARPFGINRASHRVLEKSGFELEARFKNTIYKNGEYIDELIYAIRRKS